MPGSQQAGGCCEPMVPAGSTMKNGKSKLSLTCASARTTTPPSGVSVRTESRRTCFNRGVDRFRQHAESTTLFESVSIWVKGGWKETRGLQRPISAKTPVSESRMASLNPFETKRKKAPSGTSSRVCEWFVAEGMGLRSNLLHFQVADSIIYFDEVASFSWCFGITSLAHSMPLGEIDIHPRNARGTAVYEDGASSLPFFTEKLICCKVACVEQVKG